MAERHKRNRAMASLSSINSDLVDSALPSAEDLAAAVDSMELNFFTGPGEGGRPRAISGGDRGNRPLWSPPSWARGAMPQLQTAQGGEVTMIGAAKTFAPSEVALWVGFLLACE